MSTFAVADYVVFTISVIISLSIGVVFAYRNRKQQSPEQYLLANRKLSVIPVALSVAVSFESAITLLGVPAEGYRFGIVYIWSLFALPFSFLIGTKILAGLLHPLKITSLYEYFQLRFESRFIRGFATVLGLIRTIFYMATITFGPATAIEAVTPFPYWSSIILAGVIAVVYTTIGGMQAVVWTDVFQMVIMSAGMFAILVKSAMISGGLGNVFAIASKHGRLNITKFNFDLTERTFWTLFTGGLFMHFNIIFSQTFAQRVMSVATQREAKRVLHFSWIVLLVFATIACFAGIFAFAYFQTIGCDPLASKRIQNSNQIMPLMTSQIFEGYPGVSGLYIAAIFSATLSTLSSGLNSLAAQTTEDFVRPYFKNLTESSITIIAKVSVLMYGILVIALSFAVANIQGPLTQIFYSILSSVIGPTISMFACALFCPWINQKGTLIGVLVGALIVTWISLGKNLSTTLHGESPLPPASVLNCTRDFTMTNVSMVTNNYEWMTHNATSVPRSMESNFLDTVYSINFYLLVVVGALVTFLVGSIASILTGKPKKEDVNVKYMLPFFDQYYPCLPARMKKYLYCGVDFYKDTDERTSGHSVRPEEREPFKHTKETRDFSNFDNNVQERQQSKHRGSCEENAISSVDL